MAGADKTLVLLVLLGILAAFLFMGEPDVTDAVIQRISTPTT